MPFSFFESNAAVSKEEIAKLMFDSKTKQNIIIVLYILPRYLLSITGLTIYIIIDCVSQEQFKVNPCGKPSNSLSNMSSWAIMDKIT